MFNNRYRYRLYKGRRVEADFDLRMWTFGILLGSWQWVFCLGPISITWYEE